MVRNKKAVSIRVVLSAFLKGDRAFFAYRLAERAIGVVDVEFWQWDPHWAEIAIVGTEIYIVCVAEVGLVAILPVSVHVDRSTGFCGMRYL